MRKSKNPVTIIIPKTAPKQVAMEFAAPIHTIQVSRPIAVKGITNFLGVAIFAINERDMTCLSAWNNAGEYSGFKITKIMGANPFIKRSGNRFYLSEFVKV